MAALKVRRRTHAVYFKIYRHHISVVGVVHLRRDPKRWLLREVPGITVDA